MAVYEPSVELFSQAVASVLGQTLPVLELVLVNDGGSEDFRSILPDDDRIRVFSKSNEGVAATRNFAIGKCRGEFIAFLDQDDLWYPEKLAEQMSLIKRTDVPCMVISPVDIVDASGVVIPKRSRKAIEKYRSHSSGVDMVHGLADDNFIHSSTPLIHRDVFDRLGGFDPGTRPHDDWDMYLRIAIAGFPVNAYTVKPLSVWRMHETNESRKRLAMMRSKCEVEKKALHSGVTESVSRILRSNLALDNVLTANLYYNDGEFREFRRMTHSTLSALAMSLFLDARDDRFAYEFRKRAINQMVKSARRYLFSFLPLFRKG